MKKTIVIIMLILPLLVTCQISSNIITEIEFNNININNITLSNLKSTNGNYSQIKNLILEPISQNVQQPEEQYYHYAFNGFTIGFSENEISAFEITNNNWNITIQGKTLTIGSDISVLGNVVLNNQVGGGKSVVYQYCKGCNNFLSLYIDSNNLVTKIIYIEQT